MTSPRDLQDHPELAPGTVLGDLLRRLREDADLGHADVLQLAGLLTTGPQDGADCEVLADQPETRPFLSVVTRTQGRRIDTLREVLLALFCQTDRDIEILVVGHKLSPDQHKAVERAIDDQPEEMRRRTRLIRVEDGGRSRPLNAGFAAAKGRYIAIMDDDDLPLSNWVEVYRQLHELTPGRVLRSTCVHQNVRGAAVQGHSGLRAEGPPQRLLPDAFDIFQHLRDNASSTNGLAFPRSAFHGLGIRFDETLNTYEDWDYLMRAANLLGVGSSSQVTTILRWWVEGESSKSLHDKATWDRDRQAVLGKIDSGGLLLPSGSAARLRDLLDLIDNNERNAHALRAQIADAQARADDHQRHAQHLQAQIDGSFLIRCGKAVPPPLRTLLRRLIRGSLWLVSGHLPVRLKARRARANGAASGPPAP